MRRTLRPSSQRALTVLLVTVTVLLSFLVWLAGEVGRTHVGRLLVAVASGSTLLFFAIGWATADVH